MGWRSSVLLANALAENLKPAEALAELPPISARVDGQDAVYDCAARVRTHLAAGDFKQALRDAKSVSPVQADLGSPADAVAEGAAPDPTWLRSFLEAMPKHTGPQAGGARSAAAHGRLALYEGRFEDGVRLLAGAEQSFREEGFLLDAWHVSRALAEAEAGAGESRAAQQRLQAIVAEAEEAGALLAAKLARDTAQKLGLEVAPPRHVDSLPLPPNA